ncbi:DUF6356 family protein [Sphingomonas sp.]|uniref:DUF6356 family protein n=1 Tax=Sphingomonas sp. TaxID=28214 RepID=UPI001B1C35FC|nr:DUF6356 family protein [Sphingomonas sp.]MBO9713730.1 hypothetical protein [Sphingomonas sp.]
MLHRLFLDHPRSVGESYREHLVVAAGFGAMLFAAGFACMIHAILPGLFRTTGSDIIRRLHRHMVTHRRREPMPDGNVPASETGE